MSLGAGGRKGGKKSKGRWCSKEKELCVPRIRRSKGVSLRSRVQGGKKKRRGEGVLARVSRSYSIQNNINQVRVLAFILRGEY